MGRGDKKRKRAAEAAAAVARSAPDPTDPYDIQYFMDPEAQTGPAHEVLNSWPDKVQQQVEAVLIAVAKAPPPRFSGGGKWEAMHDDMHGFYEVRVKFGKTLYRVFCQLDSDALDPENPTQPYGQNVLVLIDAASKPDRTAMPPAVYQRVRRHGDTYRSSNPRSWLS